MGPVQALPRFGKYECRERWDGGMCDVYLAEDTRLRREVVLKVLKRDAFSDPERYERFRREAELACRCVHDNIVHTYDFVEDEDAPYIVMEYLRGESLRSAMKRHALGDQKRTIEMASQLAAAMEYVHKLNIIHRDIKPANIYIETSGRLKLLDFGIARTTDWSLTDPGIAAGTLQYMSREQYMAKPERRSDIYAFGAVFFEMLTGKCVANGETREEVEAWILNGVADMSPLRGEGVPESLITLIAQCLDKDAAKRPASFTDVRRRLDTVRQLEYSTTLDTASPSEALERRPQRWTRLAVWVTAVCLLVTAGVLIWRFMEYPKPLATANTPDQVKAAGDGASERVRPDPYAGMVLVEGGPALLGANNSRVQVPSFYIDKAEVSNGAYRKYCDATPGCRMPEGSIQEPDDWPVVNVSFDQAKDFARSAGKRLPTAQEWEKAARGPNGQKLPWGNALVTTHANLNSTRREPVDSHPDGRSPYGVLNMVGNVGEWVDEPQVPDDRQYEDLSKRPWALKLSPPLTRDEPYTQIRGGSYSFLKGYRLANLPSLVSDSFVLPTRVGRPEVGFRCANDAP